MNIVSTAKISSKHQDLLTKQFSQHTFSFYDQLKHAPQDKLQDANILITYGEDVTSELIKAMPKLEWIQVISAGLELIPFSALEDRNILLTNARGIHRVQMSEYTLGMILQLARKHYQFYEQQKLGVWDRSLRVDEAYGKTLGILGLGAIGEEIARKAKAFGMNVIGLRRSGGTLSENIDQLLSIDEKDRLFQESDYLVVLLPHTADTEHFVGAAELGLMKSSAYLINIARGKVVDEEALVQALRDKTIAGAVLDVFSEEPLPKEHPFWSLDNVILTPHVSGRSPMYMTRALDIFMHNLKLYPNQGEMRNVISLSRGY